MSNDIDLTNSLMNVDLTSVETSLPILVPGTYAFTVREAKIEENSKKTGNNMNFKFTLDNEAPGTLDGKSEDSSGNPVMCKPGMSLYYTISLVKTDKYDPLQKLAQFLEAVYGNRTTPIMPVESHVGQSLIVKTVVDGTVDGPFGVKHSVGRLIKKSA